MNKRLIALAAVLAIATTGAFAQLAIGATGALYSDSDLAPEDIVARFQNGDGIYYGPFIELGLGKLALGFSANFSFYTEDWGFMQPEMMDIDGAFYLQGHLFRYRSFLDPFVEAGAGMMMKDYANKDEDPDEDNPLLATKYVHVGGGLGLNLGGLGIFGKLLYMFPINEPVTAIFEAPDGSTFEYNLEKYPIRKLKFYLGAKIIL